MSYEYKLNKKNTEIQIEYDNYIKHMADDITAANKEIEELKKKIIKVKCLHSDASEDCRRESEKVKQLKKENEELNRALLALTSYSNWPFVVDDDEELLINRLVYKAESL